jgi:hypothetical protein
LLIEEQRTNGIRNNTMQGAVAGTPGTLPTNWGNNIAVGLTQEIVGTGTENGITYVDWRLSGTATATSQIIFESNTQITAASGQAWAGTAYVKLQAGALTNITDTQMCIREGAAAGGFVRDEIVNFTPTSAALNISRRTVQVTSANASTERVNLRIFVVSAGAIDITLRVGLPQLEQGAFATSVIPTTTTALTRNADVASMTGTNFSSWYNASEGTVYFNGATATTVSPAMWSISNGTATGELLQLNQTSGGVVRFSVFNASVAQAAITTSLTAIANTVFQNASAYKVNDFASSSNAGTVGTDTSGTVPVPDRLLLMQSGSGFTVFTGTIRSIRYYPTRVTNAQLVALTG